MPGAADRIISMAENQLSHRHTMEKKMITSESRDSLLGILCAFLLGIGCIIAAIIIVVRVPENTGAITSSLLGVAGIGSITATFLVNTRSSYNRSNKPSDSSQDSTDESSNKNKSPNEAD